MMAAMNLTSSHIALAVKTAVTAVGLSDAKSAIVVMQSEVEATVSASRDRLIGTAIRCGHATWGGGWALIGH